LRESQRTAKLRDLRRSACPQLAGNVRRTPGFGAALRAWAAARLPAAAETAGGKKKGLEIAL